MFCLAAMMSVMSAARSIRSGETLFYKVCSKDDMANTKAALAQGNFSLI